MIDIMSSLSSQKVFDKRTMMEKLVEQYEIPFAEMISMYENDTPDEKYFTHMITGIWYVYNTCTHIWSKHDF